MARTSNHGRLPSLAAVGVIMAIARPTEVRADRGDGDIAPASWSPRVRKIVNQQMAAALANPAVQKKFRAEMAKAKTMAERRALGESLGSQLSHDGLASLPLADLLTWNQLRLKIAESSPAMCAYYFDGGAVPQNDLGAALATLSDGEVRAWYRVMTKSMVLAAGGAPQGPGDQAIVQQGLARAAEKLPPADRERLDADLTAGTVGRPAESCFVMKTILRHAAGKPTDEQFLREFARM